MKELSENAKLNYLIKTHGTKWLRMEEALRTAGADENYIDYIRDYTTKGPRISVYT